MKVVLNFTATFSTIVSMTHMSPDVIVAYLISAFLGLMIANMIKSSDFQSPCELSDLGLDGSIIMIYNQILLYYHNTVTSYIWIFYSK
jgi:hypothetical protein